MDANIDEAVAKALGLKVYRANNGWLYISHGFPNTDPRFMPSQFIEDSWAVVERVQKSFIKSAGDSERTDWDCFSVDVAAWKSSGGWEWHCTINNTWGASGATAPIAICLAALKSIGAKV